MDDYQDVPGIDPGDLPWHFFGGPDFVGPRLPQMPQTGNSLPGVFPSDTRAFPGAPTTPQVSPIGPGVLGQPPMISPPLPPGLISGRVPLPGSTSRGNLTTIRRKKRYLRRAEWLDAEGIGL